MSSAIGETLLKMRLKRTIAERETDVREMERGRDSALEDAKEERRVMLSIKEQMMVSDSSAKDGATKPPSINANTTLNIILISVHISFLSRI